MTLVSNWREVLRYAWSIRLNIISALLSGAEVWFSFAQPSESIPPGMFAALAAATATASAAARFVAQKKVSDAGK